MDLALGLLLLPHVAGHHCLHYGRLGSEDQSMTGEPLSLFTDDGPVGEDPPVLVTHLLNNSSRVGGGHQPTSEKKVKIYLFSL